MLDILINMNRIKYAVLEELLKDIEIEDNYVNLYIDMHTLISKIYKDSNNSEIINYDDDSVKVFVVSVLNTVAHYRRFIAKRLKKSNRIFLILNRKIPSFQSSLIPYGHMFFDRYSPNNKDYSAINAIVDEGVKYLKEVCQYFEGLYFFDLSGIEDVVAAQYLMNKYEGFNLVLSRQDIYYQLVTTAGAYVIHPNRDKSKLITKENLLNVVMGERKYEIKLANYKIYPIILMIAGTKTRDVEPMNVRGITTLIKLIDMMLENELITNDVSARSFIDRMSILGHFDEDNAEVLLKRYIALNAEMGMKALTQSQIKFIESCIVDLYDQRGLESLNNLIDDNNPIEIYDLNKSTVKQKISW